MFSTLLSVINFLPVLMQLVVAVESMFPAGGQGAVKLELVKNMLVAAHTDAAVLLPVLEPVVSGLVGAMNKTGLLKAVVPVALPVAPLTIPTTGV